MDSIHERRVQAMAHQVANRYLEPSPVRVASMFLKADLLHNPNKMPNIGERVLDINMSDSGVIEVLFEGGESFHLVTGIHWEPRDSDTQEWQEQRLGELAGKVAARHLACTPHR